MNAKLNKSLMSFAVAASLLPAGANAQQTLMEKAKQDLIQNTTYGGCIIGKAGWNDNDAASSNSDLAVRSIRAHITGQVLDFGYMLQMEMSGVSGTKKEAGPHVVDAWVEWRKYKQFCIRAGQIKRAFMFENPYHPIDIGFGSYSSASTYLCGYSDRVGEQMSHGRDQGIMLYGDLFPAADGSHSWLHYQAGIYNGQGVNHSDANDRKDLIGGVYAEPVKNLLVGVFGWTGDYVTSEGLTLDRKRWSVGLKYEDRWTARAEYVASEGHKPTEFDASTGTFSGEGKSDAWYAQVGVPVTDKLRVNGRWDAYRDQKTWESMTNNYSVALNYHLTKNLMLQANYTYTHNRPADNHYNSADLEVYVKF